MSIPTVVAFITLAVKSILPVPTKGSQTYEPGRIKDERHMIMDISLSMLVGPRYFLLVSYHEQSERRKGLLL
jgi:hypothetical protein